VESHHGDLAGAGAQHVHGVLQRLLLEMYVGPSTRRQEDRSWYNLLVANNVPRLSRVVQHIVPWQKLGARGEVPSALHDLHYIEPEDDMYHLRSTGTNLLGREGKQRKSSRRYMNFCIATEHARQDVLLLREAASSKTMQASETRIRWQ